MRKVSAFFSILVGVGILAVWAMLFLAGDIPELKTEPARIILHMVAEFITGIALIAGGFGLLALKKWGYNIYLLATGALIYTLIQSPGYYLQQGILGFVIMFAVLLLLSVIFLVVTVKKKGEYGY